jgi:hypothetical protein
MPSFVLTAVITSLVVAVTFLLDSFFSIFKIIFTRPVKRKGAVEIDTKEHIYAHPDCTKKLKDFSSIGVRTLYEVLLRGLQVGGDRPQFSYRQSSDEPFKSYSYK